MFDYKEKLPVSKKKLVQCSFINKIHYVYDG